MSLEKMPLDFASMEPDRVLDWHTQLVLEKQTSPEHRILDEKGIETFLKNAIACYQKELKRTGEKSEINYLDKPGP